MKYRYSTLSRDGSRTIAVHFSLRLIGTDGAKESKTTRDAQKHLLCGQGRLSSVTSTYKQLVIRTFDYSSPRLLTDCRRYAVDVKQCLHTGFFMLLSPNGTSDTKMKMNLPNVQHTVLIPSRAISSSIRIHRPLSCLRLRRRRWDGHETQESGRQRW